MRLWVSSFVLICAGVVLTWLGLGQLSAAFTSPAGAASGTVVRVFSDDVVGRTPRYAFELAGRTFQFVSPSLSHPSIEALKAARVVTVEYEGSGRIMGLTVDGAVFFTPFDYSLIIGASALIALIPGCAMLGFGVSLLYRPRLALRAPARAKRKKTFTLPEPAMAVVLPFRRPQKTPDGEWVH